MTAYRITIDINCPDSWSTKSLKRIEAYGRALEIAAREHAEKYVENHKPPFSTRLQISHAPTMLVVDSISEAWSRLLENTTARYRP